MDDQLDRGADEERALREVLRALVEEDTAATPSARVDRAVKAAFRSRVRRRTWLPWLGAAAAAGLLVAAVWYRPNAPRRPIPPLPRPVDIAVPAEPAPAPVRAAPDRARVVRPPRRPRREQTTEFIPLAPGSGWAPLDAGGIVRIKVSRAALLAAGLPMNMERAAEPVQAEVFYGEDGAAQAIRFIK